MSSSKRKPPLRYNAFPPANPSEVAKPLSFRQAAKLAGFTDGHYRDLSQRGYISDVRLTSSDTNHLASHCYRGELDQLSGQERRLFHLDAPPGTAFADRSDNEMLALGLVPPARSTQPAPATPRSSPQPKRTTQPKPDTQVSPAAVVMTVCLRGDGIDILVPADVPINFAHSYVDGEKTNGEVLKEEKGFAAST